MTRLLLDTNAWAMMLTGDRRLPDTARETVLAAESVEVSAISLYEIGQKVRLGKWADMAAVVPTLASEAMEAGYTLLPVTPVISLHASLLEWDNRDPFDRIIAATVLADPVPLVSSDEAFDALGVTRLWAASVD